MVVAYFAVLGCFVLDSKGNLGGFSVAEMLFGGLFVCLLFWVG